MKARYIFIVDFDTEGRWGNAPTEIQAAIDREQAALEDLIDDYILTSQSQQDTIEYVGRSFAVRERRGKHLSDLTKMKLRRS